MKPFILVALALALSACGGKDKDQPAETCERQDGFQVIEYPDGQFRKSHVDVCTKSTGRVCVYYTWVNDPAVTHLECHGG